jgi:hypothetical protein
LAVAETPIAALSLNPNTTALPSNEIDTHDVEVQTATTPPEQDVIVDPSVFSFSTSTKPTASYAAKLKAPRSNKPTVRELARIARTFAPPSNDQGFQYIYVPTNKRCPMKIMHTCLVCLGLERRRVIDVHYPDQNVVAILVHNDYAAEALQCLKKPESPQSNLIRCTLRFLGTQSTNTWMKPLGRSNLSRSNTSATSKPFLSSSILSRSQLLVISLNANVSQLQKCKNLQPTKNKLPQKAQKNQEDDNMEEIASSFQAP